MEIQPPPKQAVWILVSMVGGGGGDTRIVGSFWG